MKTSPILRKFWNVFWFLLLPVILSVFFVLLFDRAGIVEEFEIWHVLLLFALLSVVLFHMRNHLPFWRETDSKDGGRNAELSDDLREQIKEAKTLLKRKGKRISSDGRSKVEAAIKQAQEALSSGSGSKLRSASENIEEAVSKYLGFARKSALREYAESMGIAILIALALRAFAVEPFKIPSESMLATLMVGDHIFVNKFIYGPIIPFTHKRLFNVSSPKRGEVIVFAFPGYRNGMTTPPMAKNMIDEDFIKRIVGLPGDRISVHEDQVIINGSPAPRCFIGEYEGNTWDDLSRSFINRKSMMWLEKLGSIIHLVLEEPGRSTEFGTYRVPEGEVFVMGDNRDNSNDSRSWGTVPLGNIKGRSMFIWWSNRPPHGFRWDRLGRSINEAKELDGALKPGFNRCMKELTGSPESAKSLNP